MTDNKLAAVYYSSRGYWRGLAAVKKISEAAKVSEAVAKEWLKKQAIWQIYLPAPHAIPRPKFAISEPNEVHQADLLFLPHDRVKGKTYKYALTLVDVASRYKEAEPLVTKNSLEVAEALSRIYERGPLTWPKLLMVDPGREFMGQVSVVLSKHEVHVRRGRVEVHRDQGIVERFNRTLAERLFSHQYAREMKLPEGQRSTEWVARLPAVVAALNNEPTRLTGKKPMDAIKLQRVTARPSAVAPGSRSVGVGLEEKLIPSYARVRYLYQPGELEGGRRRATDPVWSLSAHYVRNVIRQSGQPAVYYLNDGPGRGFVREELMAVPEGTELPPDRILTRQRVR
jgi:hypothetical protein